MTENMNEIMTENMTENSLDSLEFKYKELEQKYKEAFQEYNKNKEIYETSRNNYEKKRSALSLMQREIQNKKMIPQIEAYSEKLKTENVIFSRIYFPGLEHILPAYGIYSYNYPLESDEYINYNFDDITNSSPVTFKFTVKSPSNKIEEMIHPYILEIFGNEITATIHYRYSIDLGFEIINKPEYLTIHKKYTGKNGGAGISCNYYNHYSGNKESYFRGYCYYHK